jgi:hypothetical protein
MEDNKRLVVETTLGQIIITNSDYRDSEFILYVEVQDDSTGDSEAGFGSNATAYLNKEQVTEIINFLNKFV